jgi:uncharacterized protein (UPF0332 family)
VSAEPPKAQAVRYWWTRAMESLAAARRDLAAGDQTFAISRAYYALFYAASALLLQEGRTFKRHAGVQAAFNREVIKAGRLGNEHGELYNRLFDDRLAGDYAAFAEFDEAYVEEQLRGCEAFLREIRPLLKSLPPEGEADGRD